MDIPPADVGAPSPAVRSRSPSAPHLRALVAAGLLGTALGAGAAAPVDPLAASELAQACSIEVSSALTTCTSFTRGVLDALRSVDALLPPPSRLCAPPMSAEARRRIFRAWARKHRESSGWGSLTAAQAVSRAFREAFPCPASGER